MKTVSIKIENEKMTPREYLESLGYEYYEFENRHKKKIKICALGGIDYQFNGADILPDGSKVINMKEFINK